MVDSPTLTDYEPEYNDEGDMKNLEYIGVQSTLRVTPPDESLTARKRCPYGSCDP
jgi:hypothetical protein